MVSVLIIGAGQFGSMIAKKMTELKCEVMAIDQDEERVNSILPYVANAQIGNCTNEEFMQTLGISDYDVCIVSIGTNFQTSLETTYLLKELGARVVVSRATNEVQKKFLLRNGADDVVYPEEQMAMRVATKYASETILDFVQLDSSYSIYEMAVPDEWDGKQILELNIRQKFDLNIISVRHAGTVTVPRADTVMHEGDVVFVIGSIKDIQKCFKI
jgi:trk system potassium uptake protein TrkA